MGMYDNIKCEYPLADGGNALDFQTKSLDCALAEYTITAEGKLVATHGGCYGGEAGPQDDFTGSIDFYTGNVAKTTDRHVCTVDDSPPRWWHYTALYSKGKLVEMTGGAQPTNVELQHVTRAEFSPLNEDFERRRKELFAANVTDSHRKAMELADQAAKASGKEAMHLYMDAAELEFSMAHKVHVEPSQSVLYRSAASLFISAGRDGEALNVIKEWMTFARRIGGQPPQEIADEIADILIGIANRIKSPQPE